MFAAADVVPAGVVRWNQLVPETSPGVYLVALTNDADSVAGAISTCPLDLGAVAKLLNVRPELKVDGQRPTEEDLAERLSTMWQGDETIVYIGLAGTSVQSRMSAYYRTPLGARRPHAGGWPLKTLGVLPSLWVHYAACTKPQKSELQMLDAFIARVSPATKVGLCDPSLPVPFANLERAKGERKKHGITGAREPRRPPATAIPETVASLRDEAGAHDSQAKPATVAPTRARQVVTHAGPLRTQRVTEADITAGRIRIPSSAKSVFPDARAEVAISLRDVEMDVRWHPHYDADQERSGVLSIGAKRLASLVEPGDVLSVSSTDGRVALV